MFKIVSSKRLAELEKLEREQEQVARKEAEYEGMKLANSALRSRILDLQLKVEDVDYEVARAGDEAVADFMELIVFEKRRASKLKGLTAIHAEVLAPEVFKRMERAAATRPDRFTVVPGRRITIDGCDYYPDRTDER